MVVRARRQPHEPTAEERANHCILHEQYRSWCRACVAGRGRLDAHTTRDGDKGLPVFGADYGYLRRRPLPAEGKEGLEETDSEDEEVVSAGVVGGSS